MTDRISRESLLALCHAWRANDCPGEVLLDAMQEYGIDVDLDCVDGWKLSVRKHVLGCNPEVLRPDCYRVADVVRLLEEYQRNTSRCPDCGGEGHWRDGVGFDHQKRCYTCNRVWQPSAEIST